MRAARVWLAASVLVAAAFHSCSGRITGTICEIECEKDRYRFLRTCESGLMDCMLGCEGFEDDECTGVCESAWRDCLGGFRVEHCLRGCPCWSTFDECWIGCGDDTGCQDGCTEAYELCLVVDPDRLFACRNTCASRAEPCLQACDDAFLGSDWPAHVECKYDCWDAELACNIECL